MCGIVGYVGTGDKSIEVLLGARMVLNTQRQALQIDRPRGRVMPQKLSKAMPKSAEPAFLRGPLPDVCPLERPSPP